MLRRLGSHVRTQWMGALSLFLVLTGGVAYAANTIGSADIIDDSIQSRDVKNNALTATDIAQNTLGFRETATSAADEIKYGSIDEWDVADNSLGFRETATSAADEIKYGSIDEWDVADNSLGRADFQNGLLPEARFNESSTGSLSATFEQITSRYVPEGSWVAFANLRTDGNSAPRPEVYCELRDPNGVIGWGIDAIPDIYDDREGDFDFIGGRATFTIQGGSQAPPGGHIISVWCKAPQAPNTGVDAQLMLIHVGRFQ